MKEKLGDTVTGHELSGNSPHGLAGVGRAARRLMHQRASIAFNCLTSQVLEIEDWKLEIEKCRKLVISGRCVMPTNFQFPISNSQFSIPPRKPTPGRLARPPSLTLRVSLSSGMRLLIALLIGLCLVGPTIADEP